MTAKQLGQRITGFLGKQPSAVQHQMFNLLDSHDVHRFHTNPKIRSEDRFGAVLM